MRKRRVGVILSIAAAFFAITAITLLLHAFMERPAEKAMTAGKTGIPSPAVTFHPPPTQSPSTALPPTPSPSPAHAKQDKAVVVFTFDDGDVSDYLLAYPILKQYGIKGTSYIAPGFIDDNVPEKLTWPQVKEMSRYGWVFGCHTYEHERLTAMTDDQIKESMEKVNQSFVRQGLQEPAIMAYPYGAYDRRVIDGVKPYRKQARLAYYQTKFVDPKHIDPYAVDSISADMKSDDRLKSVEEIVDKACEEKAVVVFRVHALFKDKIYDTVRLDEKIRSGSGPQTDSKLFEKLVEYCVNKNCAFMTMTELMQLYS